MSEPAGVHDAWQLTEAVAHGPFAAENQALRAEVDRWRAEAERLEVALRHKTEALNNAIRVAVDAEQTAKTATTLLRRWMVFKESLFKAGDGEGGHRYYGPVQETAVFLERVLEVGFRRGRAPTSNANEGDAHV